MTYAIDNTGVTTYTFDAAGNQQFVVAPSNSRTTSTWDDENRPTKVVLPAGTITTNAYRADGLRYQRQDSGGTTVFVYDGQNYLLETDGSNVTQAVYTNEPQGYGNLLNQRRKSGMSWTDSYALFDALGSTRKLTDASQNISDTYTYDGFGNQRAASGSTVNPFRYVGQLGYFYDPDTGTMNVRARTYQPGIIRWLSQDPIGINGGDDNLFRYGGNSPANGSDPTGFKTYRGGRIIGGDDPAWQGKEFPTHEYIFTVDKDGNIHTYSWGNDMKDKNCPTHWYPDRTADIDAAKEALKRSRIAGGPTQQGDDSLDPYIDEAFNMLRDAGAKSPSAHPHRGFYDNCKSEADRLLKLAKALRAADNARKQDRDMLRERAKTGAGLPPPPIVIVAPPLPGSPR